MMVFITTSSLFSGPMTTIRRLGRLRRIPSRIPSLLDESQSMIKYSISLLSRCSSSAPTTGTSGGCSVEAVRSKILTRPSRRIGSLATTPIWIGTSFSTMDIGSPYLRRFNEHVDTGGGESLPRTSPAHRLLGRLELG